MNTQYLKINWIYMVTPKIRKNTIRNFNNTVINLYGLTIVSAWALDVLKLFFFSP